MGFSEIYRTIRPALILGRQAAAGEERRRLAAILSETVCYNQGKLAEYAYTAAEKHKDLKKAVNSTTLDPQNIKQLVSSLEDYLYNEFISASEYNFEKIKAYFNGRSHREVRVCLKVTDEDQVVDPNIRDKPLYVTPDHSPADNTGFYEVDRTGKQYICNDIPKEAKAGAYKNPRLLNHLVMNYSPPFVQSMRTKLNRGYVDREWCNCWTTLDNDGNDGNDGIDGIEVPAPVESCYKSTLIVPMTLIGNNLSPEFKDRFNIKEFHDRAIYGFLCLDHQYCDYFKEEDVQICYIFSDLLSLYMIHNMVYTIKSKTYKAAIDLIAQGQLGEGQ